MATQSPPPAWRRTVTGILVGAFMLRLAVAWAPGEWLLRRVLADDPFYYFTIARQFGRGHGLTFDGVAPTNGVHPLWLFAITPIFGIVRDAWLAIHLTLTLSAALDVAALWLLHRLLREIGVSAWTAAAVAILYAVSPILLSLAGPSNGLETALNLAFTLAFLTLYRREIAEAPGGWAVAVKLGVSAGLLFLARTDNVVLLSFSFFFMAWCARHDRARRRRVLTAAFVALCIVAPWLVWSCLRFGSLIQVSGLAAARLQRELAAASGFDHAVKLGRNLATIAAYFPIFHLNSGSLARAGAANAVLVGLIVLFAVRAPPTTAPARRQRLRRRLGPWVPALLAGGAFVFVHTLRALELRGWYYTSLLPIAYVVLAVIADEVAGVARSGTRPKHWAIALVTVAGVALAVSWRTALADRCGEIDSYRVIRAVNASVPEGTLLGSWNAGLFGYFYERGAVVNLDGLVNNDAYRHHLDASLGDYVRQRKIDFLLDAGGAIDLWRPRWNRGAAVSYPQPVLDNGGQAECRRIVLVPVGTR